MTLELRAFAWLRFIRRCPFALFERTPKPTGNSRPDVIGVTAARFLIEVEVKRSMADFRANQAKPHVKHRDFMLKRWPKQFYYIVPEKLSLTVLTELPEYAGLLVEGTRDYVRVVRDAPMNPATRKLSVKECVRLAHLQSNQIFSAESSVVEWRNHAKARIAEQDRCEYHI